MSPAHLPGARWLEWLRIPSLRVGVLSGLYLTAMMVLAVLAANYLSFLEPYANARNWVCRLLFALLMLVPMAPFRRSPWQLFVAGVAAWMLFSLAYGLMGLIFHNLHNRLRVHGVMQAFVLGAGFYVTVAVALWVLLMFVEVRRHPAPESRRRP